MTHLLKDHAHLFELSGPWTTIYVDGSTGTVDGLVRNDALPRSVSKELEGAGAPARDVEAAAAALGTSARGLPDPVARYVLVNDGRAVVDEFLPGTLVGPAVTAVGPVPDLTPLMRHTPDDFAYVVAEVGHHGGEIYLRSADGDGAHLRTGDPGAVIEGDTDNTRKLPGGGWGHRRLQGHAEKVWKMNAGEVAAEIDRISTRHRAQLIVLAGDIRARQLVADQVSHESRARLAVIEANTRAAGADEESFRREVQLLVARTMADHQHALLERLSEKAGQGTGTAAVGRAPVIAALQQAQVESLLLETPAWDGETLLALDAAPWIATSEAETLGAGVLGEVPAVAALLRAAALTDAQVTLYPTGALGSKPVAALLRWPTSPDLPGTA
ncbi:baeRF2 domain-containing protein [Arthrobacter sp. MDT1-65]